MFRVNDIIIWHHTHVPDTIDTNLIKDIIFNKYIVMTSHETEQTYSSFYLNSSDNLYTDIFT